MTEMKKERAIWGLAAALLLLALWFHAAVLAPFVLSMLLAYALKPLVERAVVRGVPRPLAVCACVLLAVMMFLVLVVLLVPIVSELVPMLQQQLPALISKGWESIAPGLRRVGLNVPSSLGDLGAVWQKFATEHAEQWMGAVLSSVLIGGSGAMTVLGYVVMVPLLTFYWLMDWDDIQRRTWSLLPPRWHAGLHDVLDECDTVLGQYLRGQVIVMLILAVYYSLGLTLAGFALALPIGVFTGLAVFIPYIGFGLGLILALLVGLLQFAAAGEGLLYPLVCVAVVYGLGQVVESFFLTPHLVGQRIGLHPLAVIFLLLLFAQWLGFVGVLIALPAGALLLVLVNRGLTRYRASRAYLRGSQAE